MCVLMLIFLLSNLDWWKKTRHDFSTCSRDLSDDYSPLSLHYGVDEQVLSLKRVVLEERDNPARSTREGLFV